MSFDEAYAARTDLVPYGNNSLLLFALEMRFDIEDIETVAADALTDGYDDKKCDLIYVDRNQGTAVVYSTRLELAQLPVSGSVHKLFAGIKMSYDYE